MQITYPAGTLCLRCGVEKKDKMKGCWGYDNHLYNCEPTTVQTEFLVTTINKDNLK